MIVLPQHSDYKNYRPVPAHHEVFFQKQKVISEVEQNFLKYFLDNFTFWNSDPYPFLIQSLFLVPCIFGLLILSDIQLTKILSYSVGFLFSQFILFIAV